MSATWPTCIASPTLLVASSSTPATSVLLLISTLLILVLMAFGSLASTCTTPLSKHVWHATRAWSATCSRQVHTCLLQSGLDQLRVELAADLSEKRLNLAKLDILHVLGVCEQLRLVGQHLGGHAANQGLRVVELLLLVVVILVSILLILVVLTTTVGAAATVVVGAFAVVVVIIIGTLTTVLLVSLVVRVLGLVARLPMMVLAATFTCTVSHCRSLIVRLLTLVG